MRSVSRNGGGTKMIVDASFDGVERAAEPDAARNEGGQISFVVIVGVHIFHFARPVRGEHIFKAAAQGPAGMDVAFGKADTESGRRKLIVRPGVAALGVEQRGARGNADAAGDAPEGIDLLRESNSKFGVGIRDVGARGIGLDAEYPLVHLPVVPDRAAAE